MKLEIPNIQSDGGGGIGTTNGGSRSFDGNEQRQRNMTAIMMDVSTSSLSAAKDDSAMMMMVDGNPKMMMVDLKAEYIKLEEEKDRLKKEWEIMQNASDNIFATHYNTSPIMVVPSTSSEQVAVSNASSSSSASTPPMTNHHHDGRETDDNNNNNLNMVESRDEMLIKDLNYLLGPTASSHQRRDGIRGGATGEEGERDDVSSSSTPPIFDETKNLLEGGKSSSTSSPPSSPNSPPGITLANHIRSETSRSSSWSEGTNSIISAAPSNEDLIQQQQEQQQQLQQREQDDEDHQEELAKAAEAVTTARPIIVKKQSSISNSSSSEESMIEQLRSMNQKLEQEKMQIMADWEAISSTSSQYQKQKLNNLLPAPPSFDHNGRSFTNVSDSNSDVNTEDFIDAIEFPNDDDKLNNMDGNNIPTGDSTVHSRLTEDGIFLATLPVDDDILSAAEVFNGILHPDVPGNVDTETQQESMMKPIEHLHHEARIHKLEDIASLTPSAGASSREVWLENAVMEWRHRAESAMNELQANKIIANDRDGKNEEHRIRMLEAENAELRAIHEEMRGTMKQWSAKQRTSVDGLMAQIQEGGSRESMLLKQLGDAKAQAEGAKFRLDEYKKRNKTMDDVLLSHQNDIVTARKQVAILEDENQELRDVNKVQTEMMEMLTQLRDALQNQVHEQGKTVDSIRVHMNTHETREVEIRTELEKARMEIQNLHIQMNAAKMNKSQLMEQYSNLERTNDDTNKRIKELEQENEDLRIITVQVEEAMMAQADEEEEKMDALKKQLDDTANREALLRKTLGKAKDASELLRKEMGSIEVRNQQIARTLTTTREELRVEQHKSGTHMKELEQLRAVNRELDSDKMRCEHEMKRLQQDLSNTQIELDELKKQSKEADELNEKACKSLEEELTNTTKELSIKSDELLKATMLTANLQNELATVKQSLKVMEESTKRAEEEAARFCSPLFMLAAQKTQKWAAES